MKTIKQKAKAYDKIVEMAKIEKEKSRNLGLLEFIDENFPELKESGDERIKKEIKKDAEAWYKEHYEGSNPQGRSIVIGAYIDGALAWLEKQGESDETKAKIFLINKGYPIDANGIFPTYEEMYNIIREGLEKQGEQKSTDKVKPKFNVGDAIRLKNSNTKEFIIESIYDGKYYCKGCSLDIIGCDRDYELVDKVEPKFKFGDRVRNKKSGLEQTLGSCIEDVYEGTFPFRIKDQDDWELVEQKPAENSGKPSENVIEKEDMTEYNKGL